MMFTNVVAVCCENHETHDIDCVKFSYCLTQICGVYSYHFALRGDGV
jgi:hypothetical protein